MPVKDRPGFIYREEKLNDKGEWICVRMTYNQGMWLDWQESYYSLVRLYDLSKHRFVAGAITWGNEVY